jgi:hypothetical protein
VLLATLIVGMITNPFSPHSVAAPATSPGTDNALGHDPYPGVVTPQEARSIAWKNRLASEYMQVRAGTLSLATFQRDWQAFMHQYGGKMPARRPYVAAQPLSIPPVAVVTEEQEPQVTYYYCGPAATMEMLLSLGVDYGPYGEHLTGGPYPAYGEHVLAENGYLGTDANVGTNWTNPDQSHPVQTVLNKWSTSTFYNPVPKTGTGGFSESTYLNDLAIDIDGGYPLAGALAEPIDHEPRLIGHPLNVNIDHWIALEGYTDYGNNTLYADSIHNAYNGAYWIGGSADNGSAIWTWEGGVPAYSTVSTSSVMLPLLETFGYIW